MLQNMIFQTNTSQIILASNKNIQLKFVLTTCKAINGKAIEDNHDVLSIRQLSHATGLLLLNILLSSLKSYGYFPFLSHKTRNMEWVAPGDRNVINLVLRHLFRVDFSVK